MTTIPDTLITAVADLLRAVAARIVLPRFRHLQSREIHEKRAGEVVTIVDQEAEATLTPALLRLLPGSRVVGEEAADADPALLADLGSGTVWLVDPLDGTSNFAAGQPDFALMVALLRDGETIATWILDPLADRLAMAQRGVGAWLDSSRIRLGASTTRTATLHGVVKTRFLPRELAAALAARPPGPPTLHAGTGSAGIDYPALAAGRWQFLLYWRTLA